MTGRQTLRHEQVNDETYYDWSIN